MEIILKNLKITDPGSSLNGKKRDLWLRDGKIIKIGVHLKSSKSLRSMDFTGCNVSMGWVDIGAYSGEPGYEERETFKHLAAAAAAGGFTTVCIMPDTKPVIHSKSEVHYILDSSKQLDVDLLPIGAVSKNLLSQEMAELYSMKEAGAVAFSDASQGIQKSGLLLRALEYLKYYSDAVLIQQSFDLELTGPGQMHEGTHSTSMGLRGIPSMSEITGILRDLEIQKYSGSKLLFHKLSSTEGISLIRNAKKNQRNIFSSVSVFNLVFEDKDLLDFDANLKLSPPLRASTDRNSLIKAVLDGTLDIIVSDHTPLNPEKKDLEFQAASFGAISLETAYSMIRTNLDKEISDELWVEKVALNPRKIFNLPEASIEENTMADLTIFDPNKTWVYELNQIKSLSKNSPLVGKKLKGRVEAIFKKGKLLQQAT
ncbi:MAG: dihydroorotase [Saprospiraceae bacterium]|nr:dihydroorotase [Saprospiraceae bacterium]